MTPEEMKKRTKLFALRVVRLASAFPRSRAGDVIGRQLIKSGTSVAANYRASCMARSRAEFIAKLGVVQEEADEAVFWIDFAVDAELAKRTLVEDLIQEGKEILSIIVASKKTARAHDTKAREKARTAPPSIEN
jgi:four helix bundle protein